VVFKNQELKAMISRLNALNPLAILGRGYSVTFDASRHAVTDASELETGDEIITKLYQGSLFSKILKIEKKGAN